MTTATEPPNILNPAPFLMAISVLKNTFSRTMLRINRPLPCAIQLTLTLALSSAFVAGQTFDPGWQQVTRNLDQIASDAVKNSQADSIALAAVSRNATEWSKSYGFTDSN